MSQAASREVPEAYQPPFEDADGNRCVTVKTDGDNLIFTHGETTIESTIKALQRFDKWFRGAESGLYMDRVGIDWDGGYFSASAKVATVSLCESFDTENDYPDTHWPDPKYIELSREGATALAIWTRLTFPQDETT